MNEAFEAWFQGGANKQKLERINGGYKLSSAHLSWIAWQAASQHYEAKLAEMQAELDKARELLSEARDAVDFDKYLSKGIDAFLAKKQSNGTT